MIASSYTYFISLAALYYIIFEITPHTQHLLTLLFARNNDEFNDIRHALGVISTSHIHEITDITRCISNSMIRNTYSTKQCFTYKYIITKQV